MPTPIELISNPVSLAVFGLYLTLWALETLFPARPLPRIRGARWRGVLAFGVYFFLSSYAPFLWDGALAQYQLFNLQSLPLALGALSGVLAYEGVAYVYHRCLHRFDGLFRWVHQTHHSAEGLDVPSSFYFHPFDMLGWSLVTSLGLVLGVGLSPEATMTAVLVITFLGIFQHSNLRTPRWLGYFIQRPESHSVHHARGKHRNNYADLPVFDLIFGTFENPADFVPQTGFWDGASGEVKQLLLGQDVTAGPSPSKPLVHSLDMDLSGPPSSRPALS